MLQELSFYFDQTKMKYHNLSMHGTTEGALPLIEPHLLASTSCHQSHHTQHFDHLKILSVIAMSVMSLLSLLSLSTILSTTLWSPYSITRNMCRLSGTYAMVSSFVMPTSLQSSLSSVSDLSLEQHAPLKETCHLVKWYILGL